MEWVYLTTAPDQTITESWAELFVSEGIEVRLNPADTYSYLGVSARPCRLLVRERALARARALLDELGLPSEG